MYYFSIKNKKNNHPDAKKSGGGFTLLEMMMAIFVTLVGVTGAMSLIQRVLFFGSLSHSRLVAAYLAQEGIEIIRNVRDANWLESRTKVNSWDEGLTVCGGAGFIVDYSHSYGPSQLDPIFPCYSEQLLNIDSSGFYGYSSGTQTKYKRKVVVSSAGNPNMKNVLVEIRWIDKGVSYSLSAQENLYNWR